MWGASLFRGGRPCDRPPIRTFDPAIVFDAAFEGDQSVGPAFDRRRLLSSSQKMGHALFLGEYLEEFGMRNIIELRRQPRSVPIEQIRVDGCPGTTSRHF